MDAFTGSSAFAFGAVIYEVEEVTFPQLRQHLRATSMYDIRRVAKGAIGCLIELHNGEPLSHECLTMLIEAQDWNGDGKLDVTVSLDPNELPP